MGRSLLKYTSLVGVRFLMDGQADNGMDLSRLMEGDSPGNYCYVEK